MITIRCPHCQVSLKVDEGKIPLGITSFKCPGCKQSIPVSLLKESLPAEKREESETVLLQRPVNMLTGYLRVIADENTPEQVFHLSEGINYVGRKSKASSATLQVQTNDRFMSRNHICIEVIKDPKGGYKYLMSDNNSKNHTLYNSSYLEKDEIVVLSDGDEIVIGRTSIRFNT